MMAFSARSFVDEMLAAGFKIPQGCQRIIIDVQMDEPVRIYYQCLGDDEQLNSEILRLFAKGKPNK